MQIEETLTNLMLQLAWQVYPYKTWGLTQQMPVNKVLPVLQDVQVPTVVAVHVLQFG